MNTKKTFAVVVCFLLSIVAPALIADAPGPEKTYFAVEINGVVCGYTEAWEEPLIKDGKKLIRQETNVFVMLSMMGSEFNSEIKVHALLDPKSRRILHASTHIDQGASKNSFEITVAGGEAILVSSLHPGPKKIAITPGLLIGDDEMFVKIRKEFVENKAFEVSCDMLEILEEEIQKSTFKKIGQEKIALAGKTFDAMVIEKVNTRSGLKVTYWLAPDYDFFIKFEVLNRKVYLADRKVVDRIKVANMDASYFTRTNVAIADVQAISHMKVKARIEPTGVTLTAAGLNVPGQKFTGTVEKNIIEGVFEIEHIKYDGRNAPPFPPVIQRDKKLKKYLEPERFIESNDPVLEAKAKEIAAGAMDSWQAAVRLSQWVADNISYAIPGGVGARNTYDTRAGECGAHSLLLAAFCRAVGIPARVVFGAMYVPNYGGGFGQHGWNEIYMGAAGWIPVDSTAFEYDFVDSGHIRVSELVSATASTFNGKQIEVLEHRLGSGKAAVAGNPEFAPFLGKYANPKGGRTLTVLEKEGNLSLDIPQRMVLPFNNPDGQGRWLCKIAPQIYLAFKKNDQGRVKEMALHQIIPLTKKAEAAGADIPKELAAYVGTYLLAGANAEFTVSVKDGRLAVYNPLEKATIMLQSPGKDGGRLDEENRNSYFFIADGQGVVNTLKVDAADMFQRGEHAAELVEQAIQADGLEAGLKTYAELKEKGGAEIFFSESAFNQLGYRYLTANKLNEAIEIFKLNVQAYPQSFNVYDSLGEAYMKNNQNDLAIENFKKSLQLNPKNDNAKKALEKLGVR